MADENLNLNEIFVLVWCAASNTCALFGFKNQTRANIVPMWHI